MAFLPGLTTVSISNPPPWQMYGLGLGIAATGFAQSQVTAWRQWAGGSWQSYFDQSNSPALSNVSVVGDATNAIVFFDGTKNLPQLLAQIAGSVQVGWTYGTGNINAGQSWMFRQLRASVLNAIQANVGASARIVLVGHSLGGALAALMANYLRRQSYDVQLMTFGQPRVGNQVFVDGLPVPWLRLINANDLVTTVPPEIGKANLLIGVLTNGLVQYRYSHGGKAWRIGWDAANNPTSAAGVDIGTLEAAGQNAVAYVTGNAFGASLANSHPLANYLAILSTLAARDIGNNTPIAKLTPIYNAIYGVRVRAPQVPPAPEPIPGGELLPDPNVIIGDPPAPITIPPQDVGQRVENRQINVAPNPPQFNTPILSLGGSAVATGRFVKCTFMFSQLNQGWSETYYLTADTPAAALTAASTVNPGQTKINTLAAAMMGLRGPQCSLNAVRLSGVTLPVPAVRVRNSQLVRFTPAKVGSYAGAVAEADFFDTCIVLQMLSADNAPPKLTHMRGIPDAFVEAGGQPAGTMDAFFGAAWNNPQTGLQKVLQGDAWSWFGLGTVRNAPITNLVQDAAGTVTITTTNAPLLNGLTVGNVYPFRIAGVTKPKSINGQWPFVVNSGLLSITTRKLFGILEWDGGNQGKIVYNPQEAHQINLVRYNNIGERKAGRPSDLQRGRQPVRQRG